MHARESLQHKETPSLQRAKAVVGPRAHLVQGALEEAELASKEPAAMVRALAEGEGLWKLMHWRNLESLGSTELSPFCLSAHSFEDLQRPLPCMTTLSPTSSPSH